MADRDFVRSITERVRAAKEDEAIKASKTAAAAGDVVAAAHHEARAAAFHDSWRNPDAQREVDNAVVEQLRQTLGHPDPDVRQSARGGLEHLGVHVR